MIKDLLPQYYKDHGNSITYTVIDSHTLDGHEVGWVEFTGTNVYDEPFNGRQLMCECDFTPGIGYKVERGYKGPKGDKEPYDQIFSLDGESRCLARKAVVALRQIELREEYRVKFKSTSTYGDADWALRQNICPIILDLIEKVKAKEFIGEDSNGASFWGGYFYLETVAAITDQFIGHLWGDVYNLMAEKKIGLDGAVIQPYHEPPPPTWEEYARIEDDNGWIGIASLPGNRKMAREWKLEVLKPDGTPAYAFLPGEGLLHDPLFGPDVEDVATAHSQLVKLIGRAKEKK